MATLREETRNGESSRTALIRCTWREPAGDSARPCVILNGDGRTSSLRLSVIGVTCREGVWAATAVRDSGVRSGDGTEGRPACGGLDLGFLAVVPIEKENAEEDIGAVRLSPTFGGMAAESGVGDVDGEEQR